MAGRCTQMLKKRMRMMACRGAAALDVRAVAHRRQMACVPARVGEALTQEQRRCAIGQRMRAACAV